MFLRPTRAFRARRETFRHGARSCWRCCGRLPPVEAGAQAPSIMAPGDAIVTGFSGVLPPVPPFPSGDPLDETFINLDGAVDADPAACSRPVRPPGS